MLEDLNQLGDSNDYCFWRAFCFFATGKEEEGKNELKKHLGSNNGWWAQGAAPAMVYGGASQYYFSKNETKKSEEYRRKAFDKLREMMERTSDGAAWPPGGSISEWIHWEYLANPLRDCAGFQEQITQLHLNQAYCGIRDPNAVVDSKVVTGVSLQDTNGIFDDLISNGYHPVSLNSNYFGDEVLTASVWHRPFVSETDKEQIAKRRVRLALALLHFGEHETSLPLFQAKDDPRTRAYLIHWLKPYRNSLSNWIADYLADRSLDPSIHRSLLQALGEFDLDHFQETELDRIMSIVRGHYFSEDPGVHASAKWLLKRWKKSDSIDQKGSVRKNPN